MGMFKDVKKMKKQAKEMQKASGQRGGLRGMKDMISESSDLVDQGLAAQQQYGAAAGAAPTDEGDSDDDRG